MLERWFLEQLRAARARTSSLAEALGACSAAPLILLHGAPGTGKSALVTTLRAVMAHHGYGDMLVCAYTNGVAAALLPMGRTICIGIGIARKRRKGSKAAQGSLNEDETVKRGWLRAMSERTAMRISGVVSLDRLSCVVIDECSFVTPKVPGAD